MNEVDARQVDQMGVRREKKSRRERKQVEGSRSKRVNHLTVLIKSDKRMR